MTQTPWPTSRITQAVTDPRSVVGPIRGPGHGPGHPAYQLRQESYSEWAVRAVLHVLDEHDRELAARAAHIDVITTGALPVDRAVQLRAEMAQRYVLPVVGEVPAEQPAIYAGIADRYPPGVEPPAALLDDAPEPHRSMPTPPADLADEFTSELPR